MLSTASGGTGVDSVAVCLLIDHAFPLIDVFPAAFSPRLVGDNLSHFSSRHIHF